MRDREIVLSEIKSAVEQERQCTLRVLHLLREIEVDRHFLEMGYSSLFDFSTQELRYSAAAAQRRIEAMRLLKSFPEMKRRIEDGSLSLCVASQTQSFFRQEDRKRKEEGRPKLDLEAKGEIIQAMVGASKRECERRLAEISPEAALPREKARVIAPNKTLIQFLADDELMAKLEKLKSLMAHQNFDGRYDRLIELLADLALKKLEHNKKTRKPEQKKSLPPVETGSAEMKPSRYIPVEVSRIVWERDFPGGCTFVGSGGKRCGTRHALEPDHIIPLAFGGSSTVDNLRLRCPAHNRFTAERLGLFRP